MTDGNGETFSEIRSVLAMEKNIPPKVANRLILAALADLRDEQHSQGDRIKVVEKNSIILWAKENKLIAGILLVLLTASPVDTLYNIIQLLSSHLK